MQKKIEKFINENTEKSGFFTGGISEAKIRKIEELLNVNLPESYKWFLRKYGYGGLYGVLVLGWGKSDESIPVVRVTLDYRQLELPANFIVIEDCDEWMYCLDCDNGKVFKWIPYDTDFYYRYSDFYDFLFTRFSEMK